MSDTPISLIEAHCGSLAGPRRGDSQTPHKFLEILVIAIYWLTFRALLTVKAKLPRRLPRLACTAVSLPLKCEANCKSKKGIPMSSCRHKKPAAKNSINCDTRCAVFKKAPPKRHERNAIFDQFHDVYSIPPMSA